MNFLSLVKGGTFVNVDMGKALLVVDILADLQSLIHRTMSGANTPEHDMMLVVSNMSIVCRGVFLHKWF